MECEKFNIKVEAIACDGSTESVPPLMSRSSRGSYQTLSPGFQTDGHCVVCFEPGAMSRMGGYCWSELSGTLRKEPGDNRPTIQFGTVVRRLTPRECERLQGFPDDWTLVTHKGSESSSGARYGTLGNSMAVPCMRQIGSKVDEKGTKNMKYLSLCSGIEAASVAWEGLGWKPIAFSEIEPFPCAVLAHRYPHVPNLGDMNNYEQWQIERPDLIVGGTPCQAFSVAGLRQGLQDKRGGLTLTFVRICDKYNPDYIVWENVPGVLSSKDNAFGCFLGALAGENSELVPPGKKWKDAGCVYGPKRSIAWRCLDAQYFGLAQRRKRVFVISCPAGHRDPAQILFEFSCECASKAPSDNGKVCGSCGRHISRLDAPPVRAGTGAASESDGDQE